MAISMKCACGARLKAPEKVSGKLITCPKCGHALRVPQPVPAVLFEIDTSPIPYAEEDLLGVEVVEPSRPFYRDPVIVIGTLVPLVILIAFGAYLYSKRQAEQWRAEIARLRAEGDAAAAKGRMIEAEERYQAVLALVHGRDPWHDESGEHVAAAWEALGRIQQEVAKEKALAALEKQQAERRKQQASVELEEVLRMARIRRTIQGGAWVMDKSGHSEVLRGLTIFVLPAEFRKGDLVEEIADARKQLQQRMNPIPDAISSLRDDQSVGARQLYDFVRLGGPANRYDCVRDDKIWLRAVSRIAVARCFSNVDGKFTLELTGGHYWLYARHVTDESAVEWMRHLRVDFDEPQTIQIDLFNDNAEIVANLLGDE